MHRWVEADEEDKKKQEEIAGKVKYVLDNPPVSKSIDEIYIEKSKEAKTLEDQYQPYRVFRKILYDLFL